MFKRLCSKILILSIALSIVGPYLPAYAQATPVGTLRVTMNDARGNFEVFNAGSATPVIARAPEAGETITANVAVNRTIPEGTYDVRFGALEGSNTELE